MEPKTKITRASQCFGTHITAQIARSFAQEENDKPSVCAEPKQLLTGFRSDLRIRGQHGEVLVALSAVFLHLLVE